MIAGNTVFWAAAAGAALWHGDLAGATADLDALEATGVRAPVTEARRLSIRAGIAALDGRPAEALRLYREALRSWVDLGQTFEEGLTALDATLLLDPADREVAAITERSRSILTAMKFEPLVARLDAASMRDSRTRPPIDTTTMPQTARA